MRRYPAAAAAIWFCLLGPAASRAATIHGYVTSAVSGEPLVLANIVLKGTRLGAFTNHQGHYVVAGIPPGVYEILASYVGFSTSVRKQALAENDEVTLSMELRPRALDLEGIEVKAPPRVLGREPGTIEMRSPDLVRVPPAVEFDLFRAVQALPGVSSLSDYSAGLYVQGGSADQNLILLDDYCLEDWQDARWVIRFGPDEHPRSYREYGGGNGEPRHIFTYFRVESLELGQDGYLISFYGDMMAFYGRYAVGVFTIDENYYNYLYRDHPELHGGVTGGIGVFGSAFRRTYRVNVVE